MYDPNATLYQAPGGGGDPNATLYQAPYDPNATLMAMPGGDPNATLYQAPGGGGDPNATLYQPPGYGEATFTGNGAPVFVNNSAFIQQQLSAPPQVVPHIKLVPHNSFFPTVERDVMKTVKFGREIGENDPECVYYNSRVVSKRHAEVWAVNGEFYIRDTRSQSGTFLNAMRLSPPGEESKPFKLKNGDTIQFGVDRRGEVAPDTKCVSVVVEVLFKKIAAPTPPSPQQYAPQYPPQQYGAPPQQYGQYGAPPPGYPPQQSSYSPQHSSYSPQQYTPPPHPYGAPPQQYGAPPQQYGQQPPQQYGQQPPQQYGQQPPQARPANLLDLTLLAGNASRAK